MTRPSDPQMHEQPNPTDHAQHDLLLIAVLADRESSGEEAERANELIEACGECAALHADLVSLTTATSQLPPIPRPRDFQLRAVDAQRLRPNLVRRLLGSLGTARDGFSRPLAMGLTTLGLAGLLLGVLPGTLSFGGLSGAAASPAAEIERTLGAGAPAASQAPAAAAEPGSSNELSQGEGQGEDAFDSGDEGDGPVAIAGEPNALAAVADDSTGVSQLIVISGTLLIIGLGLFALRWTSRRFGG